MASRGRLNALAPAGRMAARRLVAAVPMLLAVSFALFALGAASPFDPVQRFLGNQAFTADAEAIARLREALAVDEPFVVQWWTWLTNAIRGELGHSLALRQPVGEVLAERLGWTVLLVGPGFALALVLGLVLGTACAAWRGSVLDRVLTGLAYTLESIPVFALGLLSLWVFALWLGWLPAGGVIDATATEVTAGQVARHMVLPVVVLGVQQMPWFLLYVRQSVAAALAEDYVRGARARGLSPTRVLAGHALPTALLAWLTLLGTRLPEIITGALLIETVFAVPGVAAATVTAATAVDFPLLAAMTLLGTAAVLLGNLLADVLYTVADPRVAADG
jgi:peptide/nickel transport system permease protein